MRKFGEQYKPLIECKKEDDTDTPKISNPSPISWVEEFRENIDRWIGVRNETLAYVIMESVDVPADWPMIDAGQLYSEEFKSIEEYLINKSSYTHGLFRDNIVEVYCDGIYCKLIPNRIK